MPKTKSAAQQLFESEIVSPFDAYSQRKEIEAKIAALQKQSKQLKTILESGFRTNQKRLVADDGSGLVLSRVEKTIPPFSNPGYSYWIYTLATE